MIGVLGIDPGVRGGLALLNGEHQLIHVRAFRPDMTEEEFVSIVGQAVRMAGGAVYLEKVQYIGRRADGSKDGGQGAFTFGAVYGLIRGAVLANGHRPHYVYPLMWQTRLECVSGGVKNVTKARAAQLFPDVKMTHAIADALLIAEYGWRCQNR